MAKPTKQPKPKTQKPASEMTEEEALQDWRRKRAARGPLSRPNLKGSRKDREEK